MKSFMNDFKTFALSGNIVDLAIGVILGLAFQAVVASFANDVLMQLIGAIFTVPDFSEMTQNVRGTEIGIGKLVQASVSFLLIAVTLLFIVKGLMRLGMNFRAQGNRECDFCKSFVPVDATKCMYCTSELEPVIAD
jgi:large conductance mechanosensitive channel